jgi:hypothetical protein
LGVDVSIFGECADVRLLAEMAAEAEASGWDGFWLGPHPSGVGKTKARLE